MKSIRFDVAKQEAHERNIDAAQREIDDRAAGGEDMSNAVITTNYEIVFLVQKFYSRSNNHGN